MEKYGKLIIDKDNVITVVADCESGDTITIKDKSEKHHYVCNQSVPFGHKIAIKDINIGENIIKYGEAIGAASKAIKKGDWVHIHNTIDTYKVLDKAGNPL